MSNVIVSCVTSFEKALKCRVSHVLKEKIMSNCYKLEKMNLNTSVGIQERGYLMSGLLVFSISFQLD